MSADKKHLHNRAKKLLNKVKELTADIGCGHLVGLHYCWEGGAGLSFKKGCVKIHRRIIDYTHSNLRISQIIFIKDL